MVTNNVTVYQFEVGLDEVFADEVRFRVNVDCELGPLSSGQGKSMQFVDPDRIEQSDHMQAASFAPLTFIISIIIIFYFQLNIVFSLYFKSLFMRMTCLFRF